MANAIRHSHTFKLGDMVSFFDDDTMHREHLGKSFEVVEINDVPTHLIEYNHETGGGGAGHHQWIVLGSGFKYPNSFSGLWFQPPADGGAA